MKFLNGKEQVMDIQLTSYGKYLLSKGEFRPHFYSFFDDGILYDSQYAGIQEGQKEVQNRIKIETPRLEAQHNYAGVETTILHQNNQIVESNGQGNSLDQNLIPSLKKVQINDDKFHSLKYPIGTSDANTEYAAAWDVRLLKGALSGTSSYLTGSTTGSILSIPQLNTHPIRYKSVCGITKPNQNLENISYVFPDGGYIDVMEDNGEIIIDLSEQNVFFGESNFDLEVYSVEDNLFQGQLNGTGDDRPQYKQTMTPLYFVKPKTFVKDNILLDDEDIQESEEEDEQVLKDSLDQREESDNGDLAPGPLDPSYVEYFLSIDVDNEIESSVLCDLTIDKTQGVFSRKVLDCEDNKKKSAFNTENVFSTDVVESDLGECE